MSMITIDDFGEYEQVVMGWDPNFEGFFFYCLESISDDDPKVWEVKITDLDVFEIAVNEAGIFLPKKIKNLLLKHSENKSQEILAYYLEDDTVV